MLSPPAVLSVSARQLHQFRQTLTQIDSRDKPKLFARKGGRA